MCRIGWHEKGTLPQIGFVVANSQLSVEKVVKVYNHRAEIENRIKESNNTLGCDKTSCHRLESYEARLGMGVLYGEVCLDRLEKVGLLDLFLTMSANGSNSVLMTSN